MADEDFAAVEEGLLPWPACSPAIEDDFAFRGIRIAAPARVVLAVGGGARRGVIGGGDLRSLGYAGRGRRAAAVLRGVFRVPYEVLGEPARPLQRHLVLVARAPGQHRPVALMPFREHALFVADDSDAGGVVHGYFNLALGELIGAGR